MWYHHHLLEHSELTQLVLLCAVCRLFSYLYVWLDPSPPSLHAMRALSLAALPAGWWKHQPRDTENRQREGPGLLMMNAGARTEWQNKGTNSVWNAHLSAAVAWASAEEKVNTMKMDEEVGALWRRRREHICEGENKHLGKLEKLDGGKSVEKEDGALKRGRGTEYRWKRRWSTDAEQE